MDRTDFHPLANDALRNRSGFRRFLLLSLLGVLLIDLVPGMGLGIAPGLSAKNLYLYAVVIFIAAKAVTRPAGFRFTDLDIHGPFLLLIIQHSILLAG